MSKAKAPPKRIKVADDSFDVIDASGTIGVRYSDQISHVGVEFRRYREGEKRCDRREGFLTAFPKASLPEIIDNLARLALTDKLPSMVQFQGNESLSEEGKRIGLWKTRIQNAQERDEIVSLLRLMVEVGDQVDLRALMGTLGRFVQKHEQSNPHLAEKYMQISEEMFPEVVTEADARFLEIIEPQGSA